MKLTGLDGHIYNFKYKKKLNTNPSGLHLRARKLLHELYPCVQIFEEVYIPGGASRLFFDFVVVNAKLAVEVNGRQHKKFIPYFHGSYAKFLASQKRDVDKEKFCELNHFALVKLPYDECEAAWRSRILSAESGQT